MRIQVKVAAKILMLELMFHFRILQVCRSTRRSVIDVNFRICFFIKLLRSKLDVLITFEEQYPIVYEIILCICVFYKATKL